MADPKKSEEGPTVEAGVLARLFGLTPTRISQMGKAGTLPKAKERGKYLLWPSIKNYIAALKNPKINGHGTADGSEMPEGIRSAKQRKIELECEKLQRQIDVINGKLVFAADVEADGYSFGMAAKQMWEEIEDALPPMLEGLTAAQMKEKLRGYARSRIMDLHEHFAENT